MFQECCPDNSGILSAYFRNAVRMMQEYSFGSILVLAAAICWGFENNFTRKISSKNTYQIVVLKGIFSGIGSLIVALIMGDWFTNIKYVGYALMLGFVAYGLSIFLYVRAQKELGAAKTSSFYAIAPFAGALLSFLILKEPLTRNYIIALIIMLVGSALVVFDTMFKSHTHVHTHCFVHTHDDNSQCREVNGDSQLVEHSHKHTHYMSDKNHFHHH
jgi:drug/metabolite transporter (DMT)-like permease